MVFVASLASIPSCVSSILCRSKMTQQEFIELVKKLDLHSRLMALATGTGLSTSSVVRRAAVACLDRLFSLLVLIANDHSFKSSGYLSGSLSFNVNLVPDVKISGKNLVDERIGALQISVNALAFDVFASKILSLRNNNGFLSSPSVRLAMWKLVASICQFSLPSSLRKIGAHEALLLPASERSSEMNDEPDDIFEGNSMLLWFFRAPFADPDKSVREYAADNLGAVLLSDKAKFIFTLFLKNSEWRSWLRDQKHSSIRYADLIVDRFYREIDSLLYKYCYVDQSQLSFTATAGGSTVESTSFEASTGKATAASGHQCSALSILSCICRSANIGTPLGLHLFEHSLLRLVRFWVCPNSSRVPCTSNTTSIIGHLQPDASILSSLAHEELCKIDAELSLFSILMTEECRKRLLPAIFAEILVTTRTGAEHIAGDRAILERHFNLLVVFIRSFLIFYDDKDSTEGKAKYSTGRKYVPQKSSTYADLLHFIDSEYRVVVPALIRDEDYHALKQCALFRLYLLEQMAITRKAGTNISEKEMGGVENGDSIDWKRLTTDLGKHVMKLCAAPGIVKEVLPILLLHPDRAPWIFYFRTVLGGSVELKDAFAEKNVTNSVKTLAWKLGEYDDVDITSSGQGSYRGSHQVVLALKKLGLIHDIAKSPDDDAYDALKTLDAAQLDASSNAGLDSAKRLISSKMVSA